MIQFDAATLEKALTAIRRGIVPHQFCYELNMEIDTLDTWANNDADIAQKLATAKCIGADVMMSECIAIADSISYKADAKKVMIDTRQKMAAVWNPAKYGPKADKDPGSGIQAHVHVPYKDLPADKRAAVDKFFGTDEDD